MPGAELSVAALAAALPSKEDSHLKPEALRLAQWRRVVLAGDGPGLTLAEAAAVLGTSVRSVQRRVKSGELQAYHDDRGRVRIAASVTGPDSPEVGRLWEEYKILRARLEVALSERARLAAELEEVKDALAHSQRELTAMWRLLRSPDTAALPQDEVPARPVRSQEVLKIQGQISDIRERARRRRVWTLVG